MDFDVLIVCVTLLFGYVIVEVFSFMSKQKRNMRIDCQYPSNRKTSLYEEPSFKPLSRNQIDDIHSRGKITPEEKVKEWESLDLCAPGDAIGSAAWRCRKFRNCHDCLIDYTNEYGEYTSFFDILNCNAFSPLTRDVDEG